MAAHAALAAVLAGQSDRRAWHRAAAALGPDETVAAELDDAASRAERRAAISVAITALERAVELSLDPVARNSRLLRAAQLSFELGRPALVDRFVRDVDRTGLNPADRARLALLQQHGPRQSGPPGRRSRTPLPVERDQASPPAPPAGAAERMSGGMPDSPLIGRSGELSRLQALIGRDDGGALVVLGEAGIGKSALLATWRDMPRPAGSAYCPQRAGSGNPPSPSAGLRQLLRPVLVELLALPGRHAEELRAALSLASMPAASDPLLTSAALLELLAGPPDGVLVLVDDAQWMDGASLEVLALAARRLGAGTVTMIFAARGDVPPPGLDQGIPELRPGPLSAVDAGELLAAQPHPPRGCARAQVLAQAAGNPLALIELARAIAADPAAGRGWGGLPLPLTGRLRAVFAAQLGALPVETRHALLSVAVADGDVRVPGLDPAVLAPAEELGLITVDTSWSTLPPPADPVGCLSRRAFRQPRGGTPQAGRDVTRPAGSPRLAPGGRLAASRRGHRVGARRYIFGYRTAGRSSHDGPCPGAGGGPEPGAR